MKQKKVEQIINEAIGFIHLMSDDTVSEKEGKKIIKRLQKVKFCNLPLVSVTVCEHKWTVLGAPGEIFMYCEKCGTPRSKAN